jgi:hypothetical protein
MVERCGLLQHGYRTIFFKEDRVLKTALKRQNHKIFPSGFIHEELGNLILRLRG